MRAHNRPNGNPCANYHRESHRCYSPAVGRSKYCASCRSIARQVVAERARRQAAEKRARYDEAELILAECEDKAGTWLETTGQVRLKPATITLAQILKREEGWRRPQCGGGVVSPPFPSLGAAEAYAATLRAYGLAAEVVSCVAV